MLPKDEGAASAVRGLAVASFEDGGVAEDMRGRVADVAYRTTGPSGTGRGLQAGPFDDGGIAGDV